MQQQFVSSAIAVAITAITLGACSRSATVTADTSPNGTEETAPTEPPPPAEATPSEGPASDTNREGHDEVCGSPTLAAPTEFTCEFDTQCVICHDGSACGIVVNRAEYERRGAECEQEDAAMCEYMAPRCCDGHCVLASY